MDGIAQRQNEDKAIKMLAAQSAIYSDTKRKLALFLALAGPVMMLAIITASLVPVMSKPVAICSFALLLAELIWLQPWIKSQCTKAAAIQDRFDRHNYAITERPVSDYPGNITEDIVTWHRHYLDHSGSTLRFKDWYTLADVDCDQRKVLLCQNQNVFWDTGLRKRFLQVILLCAGLVLILAIATLWTTPLGEALIFVLTTSAPIVYWSLTFWGQNREALHRNQLLASEINALLEKAQISTADIEWVQQRLFENRQQNPLVFDWLYFMDKKHRQVKTDDLTDGLAS